MQSPRIRAWDTQRLSTLLQIFQAGLGLGFVWGVFLVCLVWFFYLERKKRLYCLFFCNAESNIFKMHLAHCTQQCHSHGFSMEYS